jgi:Cof subfamily protein (haloacid dehalogenase superfamily)
LIRLIGIDVDGTLVGASGQVASQIWQAAARARAAGIRLVLCSGRPVFGVTREYARELDPEGWHVFQNGASIVHFASEESLSTSLPAEAIDAVVRQARSTGWVLELYSDREYVTESTLSWAREHAELLGIEFAPRPFATLNPPIVRAQWLVSARDAPAAIASAPANLEVAQSSSPLMPQTQFVGLTRAGVTKGSALRAVAEKYGIGLQHTMYVGDAGNDLPALRVAGVAVAMGNAHAAVIAEADHVVGDVDEGGLSEAIELAITGAKNQSSSRIRK